MRQSEREVPVLDWILVLNCQTTYVGLPIVLQNWSTSRPLDELLGSSLQVRQPPLPLAILVSPACLRHSEREEVGPSVDRGCVG